MTKITIFKKNGKIWSYQIKGHSGFAEEGKDIVCSAISTAAQMTLLGLEDVLNMKVESDIQDGYLQVRVLEKFEDKTVQVLMITLEETLKQIAKEYAKFVKMEVKEDVVY